MSFEAAERLARALLFEGYVLYPYRRSSLKNQQRWAFGSLYPPAFSAQGCGDASTMQTECLIEGAAPHLRVAVCFLHFVTRGGPEDGPAALPWQEGIERRVAPDERPLSVLAQEPYVLNVDFPEASSEEQNVRRIQRALGLRVVIAATREGEALWKVRVSIRNQTHVDASLTRQAALLRALVSTHTLLGCRDGRFVSLLEPRPELVGHVSRCKNEGTFPVLVGCQTRDDTMLSSPIILYDRPRVAPESAGDLFDATEIDEILTLRILTLTDEEKHEVLRTDPRARALLERTESLGEDAILRLHGAARKDPGVGNDEKRDQTLLWPSGLGFHPGDRVLLRPRAHGDVIDLALSGEAATIAKIEQDLEGRMLYAVTVDADPGWDLGVHGQPGHRFYFHADELERIP